MTPEAARYLDKARQCLADASLYRTLVPRIAAREAYLAAFHAAEALVSDRTGKSAKTHRGLRAQFAHIARDEPRIGQPLTEFLAQAYELKSISDYGTGPEAIITAVTANAAVDTAERFVACVADFLGDPTPPGQP